MSRVTVRYKSSTKLDKASCTIMRWFPVNAVTMDPSVSYGLRKDHFSALYVLHYEMAKQGGPKFILNIGFYSKYYGISKGVFFEAGNLTGIFVFEEVPKGVSPLGSPLPQTPLVTQSSDNDSDTTCNRTFLPSSQIQTTSPLVISVIEYLNKKAGTKFRANSEIHANAINARHKEGAALEDFYRVIDIKVEQWGKDDVMAKFLRPSTLFGKEKFANYLGENHETTEELERGIEEILAKARSGAKK